MPENEPLNIVFGADNGYAMPLAVAMSSVLINIDSHTKATIFILDGGISAANKKRILRVFHTHAAKRTHTLQWLIPNMETLRQLPTAGRPPAIYMPLFLADYLPKDCKKAIFLDCDLITERDLSAILEYDMSHHVVGAVQDYLIQTLSDKEGIYDYGAYGGKADSPYFNSGVLLINLEQWRKQNITKKAAEYLNSRKQIIHYDQEALNAVLIGKWKRLDPRWNQQGSIFWPQVLKESEFSRELLELYEELVHIPYIIHFLSPSKPWEYTCMHPFAFRFTWYLKTSNWYTKYEWEKWWFRIRYLRGRWLFNDFKRAMQLMKPSNRKKADI